jgi:hypothetical protein
MIFGSFGIQAEFNRAVFRQQPRRDQDATLQWLYDKGYSVPEIGRFLEIPCPTIYHRIEAHRGRGPQTA